jgi:hypothetical protein
MQGTRSPAEPRPPGMSDEEWEAAAPADPNRATDEDELDDLAADAEAPGTGEGKQKPSQSEAFPDSEELPDIDDPLEFHAQLLKVQDTSGSQGDNIQAHFEAPWQNVLQVVNRYKRALELRFGNVSIIGASLKSQSTNTDADGNVRLKVTFQIPESQKNRAGELFLLTGAGGPLTISPTQLSLDSLLTTRAEDDPIGTFSDVDEDAAETS